MSASAAAAFSVIAANVADSALCVARRATSSSAVSAATLALGGTFGFGGSTEAICDQREGFCAEDLVGAHLLSAQLVDRIIDRPVNCVLNQAALVGCWRCSSERMARLGYGSATARLGLGFTAISSYLKVCSP